MSELREKIAQRLSIMFDEPKPVDYYLMSVADDIIKLFTRPTGILAVAVSDGCSTFSTCIKGRIPGREPGSISICPVCNGKSEGRIVRELTPDEVVEIFKAWLSGKPNYYAVYHLDRSIHGLGIPSGERLEIK
jgi:hypothetical protein